MKLSQKMLRLGTESAFRVLAQAQALEAKGIDVIHLEIGEPDFATPENITDAAARAVKEGYTHYCNSQGMIQLRTAIAREVGKRRGITVDPECVVVTPGAKPVMFYSILALLEEGDEAIYPDPGFPIFKSMIDFTGARAVPLPMREELDFCFDIDQFKSKVTSHTRLIIVNSPHNPTGGVLDRGTLEQIADIVKKYDDLWVFSDEPYSRMVHEGDFTSIASIPGMQERTIIVDGVSKTYAMTGWRIGFASNEKLAECFSRWVTNTDSCAGHPNQYAALTALNGPQNQAEEMMASFKRRRHLIVEGLNRIDGIRCLRPRGAFYAWPNVTDACRMVGAKDSEDFRKRLLQEAGVAVLSDIHFGHRNIGEGEHIRFSYATSEANIQEGLRRIKDYIRKSAR